MRHSASTSALATALVALTIFVLGQVWSIPAAFGQGIQNPIVGLEDAYALLEDDWVDPIERFELTDEPLAPEPTFDFAEIQPSDVFEPGVESLAVSEEVDVVEESERHLRALQTVATAELALQTAGDDIETSRASIVSATSRIGAARREIVDIESQIAQLKIENEDLTAADRFEVDEQARLNGEVDQYNVAITELAIQAFIGQDDDIVAVFEDPGSSGAVERRIVTDEIRNGQREEIADREVLLAESVGRREALAEELAVVERETSIRIANIAGLNEEIDGLDADILNLEDDITALQDRSLELGPIIDETTEFTEVTAAHYQVAYHERLAQFIDQTDLPLVAVNAYVRASGALAVEDPGCGIHWSQLAGIGRIESIHGYFGESTLDVNGHTTVDIRGLPLDGRILSGTGPAADPSGRTETTAGVQRLALIRDTDNGLLDGDTEFDRAVGPMQFIPTTWRLYDADGNGDGTTDPQNMYDAALAAARYLCDAPGSMLTAEGEQRAYFAYNHDFAYSRNVTLAGRRYHKQLSISPENSPRFAAYAASGAAEALADLNVFGPPEPECPVESDEGTQPDEAAAEAPSEDSGDEQSENLEGCDTETDSNEESNADEEQPDATADDPDAAAQPNEAVEPEVLSETETTTVPPPAPAEPAEPEEPEEAPTEPAEPAEPEATDGPAEEAAEPAAE